MITHFRQAIEETLPGFPLLALTQRGDDPFTLFAGMAGNPAAI